MDNTKSSPPPPKRARKQQDGDPKRQEILRLVQRRTPNVLHNHPEYQDDDEVVEASVRSHPLTLQFASVRLRNDRKLASLAAEINVQSLQYVSDALKDDQEFCQALLAKEFTEPRVTKEILAHMSPRLKNDKEIILQAVRIHGVALEHASPELRGDREVVLEAVRNQGDVLEYASQELRGDKQVVLAAMKSRSSRVDNMGLAWNGRSLLEIVSQELKDDQDVVEAALQGHGGEISHASERLQNSPKIVAAAFLNLRTVYRNRVGAVQALIQRDDRCQELKDRLRQLKALLQGRKFPLKLYNPRQLSPTGLAGRMMADMVHRKWCVQQIVSAQDLPADVGKRVFAYSGTTTDDYHVANEIRNLAPFLVEAADKFHPRYASWWVFLTGKCTGWFEKKSSI